MLGFPLPRAFEKLANDFLFLRTPNFTTFAHTIHLLGIIVLQDFQELPHLHAQPLALLRSLSDSGFLPAVVGASIEVLAPIVV